jgi:uracil-DNA glycosylase
VVIAINLHNASGLLTEYEIVCSSAGTPDDPSQIGSFEAGQKQAHRSPFAYRSVRTAAMLLDALDGVAVNDRSDPVELVAPINRITRLQAVKCAPDDGQRGSPTATMRRNCPPMLLQSELAILEPSLILTIGKPAEHAIARLPDYRPAAPRRSVKRATVSVNGKTATVYSIAHPVSPAAWQTDHAALKRHLRRKQLARRG